MTPAVDRVGHRASTARCPENAGRAISLFPNVPSVPSLTPSQRFLVHQNSVRLLPHILQDWDRLQRPVVRQAMTACVIQDTGAATVLVRNGKTDAEGRGAVLYLARDSVTIVREWLVRSGVGDGRLFRSLRRGELGEALDPSQIPRIYKAMARRAGLEAEAVDRLSGHSTRVGAAQDMIAYGIELPAILQAGRWKSTAMVNRYGEQLLAQRSAAAQLARMQSRG